MPPLLFSNTADFARCRNMARQALKTKADGETRHFPSKEALPQCTVGAPLRSQRPTRRGQGRPLAGPALFRHPPCTAPDIHHPRCFPLCRPHQPEVIPRRGPLNTHRPPRLLSTKSIIASPLLNHQGYLYTIPLPVHSSVQRSTTTRFPRDT